MKLDGGSVMSWWAEELKVSDLEEEQPKDNMLPLL